MGDRDQNHLNPGMPAVLPPAQIPSPSQLQQNAGQGFMGAGLAPSWGAMPQASSSPPAHMGSLDPTMTRRTNVSPPPQTEPNMTNLVFSGMPQQPHGDASHAAPSMHPSMRPPSSIPMQSPPSGLDMSGMSIPPRPRMENNPPPQAQQQQSQQQAPQVMMPQQPMARPPSPLPGPVGIHQPPANAPEMPHPTFATNQAPQEAPLDVMPRPQAMEPTPVPPPPPRAPPKKLPTALEVAIAKVAKESSKLAPALSEEEIAVLSSKPRVLGPEEINQGLYQMSSHTDGKPVFHLTNYRIFEGGDINQVHFFGGRPDAGADPTQCAMQNVAGMGTVTKGAGQSRVRLPKLVEWRIANVMGGAEEGADAEPEMWVGSPEAWFVLREPDSVMSAIHQAMTARVTMLSTTLRMLTADSATTIPQVVEALAQQSSGALREEDRWWLWRMRVDRYFLLNFFLQHEASLLDTPFSKALRDIVFSNELCASYPEDSSSVLNQNNASNRYASIISKYSANSSREMQNRLEVVPTDCDDPEAVRKLTDRCVVAVRGKYRGRSGYIVGAGKGCYIVSIDGEEVSIKGSHLELRVEDYCSSEDHEPECLKVAVNTPAEAADGEGAAPVRRSVRLDPEFDEITGTRLVQKRVIIREGKLCGQIGRVASSGHGFYCVRARGIQAKLRRREFEVIEDDPSENMLSRASIEGGGSVELKGVAAGSDNHLVGKTCLIKNGAHKGQVGKVDAYTYGIYSLHLLEVPDGAAKLLLLGEDMEELHEYSAPVKKTELVIPRETSNESQEEEKEQNAAQVGKRAAFKGGKYDGRVGTISGADHGYFTVSFSAGDEMRVRPKEVLVLQVAEGSTLAAGFESAPTAEPEEPSLPEGHARLLVGKHAGKVARVVSTENGWTQAELDGTSLWVRTSDTITNASQLSALVPAPEPSTELSAWVDKTVRVTSGLAAAKVGTVRSVLDNRFLLLQSENAEIRVSAAACELVVPLQQESKQEPFSEASVWAIVKDSAGVGARYRGRAGRVLGRGFDWVYLQIGADEVRVKEADLIGLTAKPPNLDQEDEALTRKRTRDEDSDGSRPSSREQRPKRSKPEKKEEEEEEEGGINMANAADGTLVKIRVGEHSGKTGVILWSGHGWINIKVGNEEVRIRSRDIAPADSTSTKPSSGEADASPIPKSKVAIRVGKHKGQTGRVLSSGHGWLWVQLGKEEVRVRRKDVTTLSK